MQRTLVKEIRTAVSVKEDSIRKVTSHTHTHTLVLKIIIQICGKFSIIMNGFNRHSITHIGVRNYEYENFGMKFTDKDNINRHILVHEIMNVNFMEKYLSRRVTLTHSN